MRGSAPSNRARSMRGDRSGARPATAGPWLVRVLVLGAFAATVAIAGPRAWRVLGAELQVEAASRAQQRGPALGVSVPLDRVGSFVAPDWLQGELLRCVLEDLEPRLRTEVRLMDDDAANAARAQLAGSAFVRGVQIERRFPDRFRISLDLRRPEVEVLVGERRIALVDADGLALPAGSAACGLPQVDLEGYDPAVPVERLVFGDRFPDLRVVAAARVAREWRAEVAPAVGPDAPRLVAVDARNVGWRWIRDLGTSQILVGVEREDGGIAWFHYGAAAEDAGPATAAVRARVLRMVLDARPGLSGLASGDLRLLNTWRESLR